MGIDINLWNSMTHEEKRLHALDVHQRLLDKYNGQDLDWCDKQWYEGVERKVEALKNNEFKFRNVTLECIASIGGLFPVSQMIWDNSFKTYQYKQMSEKRIFKALANYHVYIKNICNLDKVCIDNEQFINIKK